MEITYLLSHILGTNCNSSKVHIMSFFFYFKTKKVSHLQERKKNIEDFFLVLLMTSF